MFTGRRCKLRLCGRVGAIGLPPDRREPMRVRAICEEMRRTRVRSAGVVSVGYDRTARVLEIEYPGGRRYRYFDVPPAIHDELMAAASKGIYVNAVIKPGFACEAVGTGNEKKRRAGARRGNG